MGLREICFSTPSTLTVKGSQSLRVSSVEIPHYKG